MAQTAYLYEFETTPQFREDVTDFCNAEPGAGEQMNHELAQFLSHQPDVTSSLRGAGERDFYILSAPAGPAEWLMLLELDNGRNVVKGHYFDRYVNQRQSTSIRQRYLEFAEAELGI